MPEYNGVWDEYIGPSSWRTLLAFESWALRDSRPIDLPGKTLQDVGWPDEEKQPNGPEVGLVSLYYQLSMSF